MYFIHETIAKFDFQIQNTTSRPFESASNSNYNALRSGGELSKFGEKTGHVSLCHEIWKEEWKRNTTQDLLVSEIWIVLNACSLTDMIHCKAKALILSPFYIYALQNSLWSRFT